LRRHSTGQDESSVECTAACSMCCPFRRTVAEAMHTTPRSPITIESARSHTHDRTSRFVPGQLRRIIAGALASTAAAIKFDFSGSCCKNAAAIFSCKHVYAQRSASVKCAYARCESTPIRIGDIPTQPTTKVTLTLSTHFHFFYIGKQQMNLLTSCPVLYER
jgi:hypothetical protein